MPAAYWWAPQTDTLFGNPENWMKGPSIPWDYYESSDPAPSVQDDLYFQGGVTDASCLIPSVSDHPTYGYAFKSIRLLPGSTNTPIDEEELPGEGPPPSPPAEPIEYTGTVTLSNSFAVGTLEVASGFLSQADANAGTTGSAGTLTVKSNLA